MFNINPHQIAKVMKQMGIEQEEIPASEVIITTTEGKKIIIKNPQVIKLLVQGQQNFQISGEVVEEENDSVNVVSKEDIKTVIEQTGVSEEKAREKLIENKGDLAKTILDLKE